MKQKIITLLILLLCVSTCVQAQTSKGDKLFAEGQALQKKKQYKAAILKYQAAKVAYTTEEKKQMCEAQILLCRPAYNKNQIQDQKTGNRVSIRATPQNITLSGEEEGHINVNINASDTTWFYEVPEGLAGESVFVSVERMSPQVLSISAGKNNTTLERHQSVYLRLGDISDTIKVVQSGKTVSLKTNRNILEYGLKGGSKTIEVITNSDSTITTFNNQCWYVESKPEWIDVTVMPDVEESSVDKAKTKIKNFFKNTKVTYAEDEKATKVNISVVPLIKSDAEYTTGRRGEIILASQSTKYKVIVVQQK